MRRAEPRLTASLRLPQSIALGPGLPLPSPGRTCRTRDRESFRAALPLLLSSGVFGRRQGCEPASDTLCRDPHEENRQIRLHDPSRQRQTASSDQGACIGVDLPFPLAIYEVRLRRPCFCEASGELFADVCIRMRSASTTSNRSNPGSNDPREGTGPPRGCPHSVPDRVIRPLRDAPAEAPRLRGPRRLSPLRTPPSCSAEADHVWAGRPRPAATRAPSVAKHVVCAAGEATPTGTPDPGTPFNEPAGDTRRDEHAGSQRACFREARRRIALLSQRLPA
jgi:hypothetical protein